MDGPGTAKSGMHWPSVELLFLCMEYPPLALGQGDLLSLTGRKETSAMEQPQDSDVHFKGFTCWGALIYKESAHLCCAVTVPPRRSIPFPRLEVTRLLWSP